MNKTIKIITSLLSVLILMSCHTNQEDQLTEVTNESSAIKDKLTNKVLLSSEIKWEKLNPARGEQSPQAGTIWGDRNAQVPTGFLAKFKEGFSSPPHIHNETYRAVVIKGSIHNDDPEAANMWMKSGSFWTQPKGASHITAAQGQENIALVEIDKGPYLVQSIEDAYDNGERPINIDASNVVWLDNTQTTWIDTNTTAQVSFLWASSTSQGMFIKIPKNFNGNILTDGTVLHAVVIQGEINYTLPQNKEVKALDAGSSFSSSTPAVHNINNRSQDAILYLKTNGELTIKGL